MSLRKGSTFSSPQCVSSDLFNLENQRHMPRRSPTSTESLEELLHDSNGSRAERISRFLDNIDSAMTSTKSTSNSGADILNDREVLPVPQFMLDNARLDSTPMEIDSDCTRQRISHDHASDSGLGSSIDSKNGCSRAPPSQSEYSHMHAINSSFAAAGAQEEKHTLSEYASGLIRKSIVDPILAEESLKDFHPLIKDVPRRIGEKNICNLRDLEKTLIFLAPVSGIRYLSESAKTYCILRGFQHFSATSESYRLFCERTIQLLQVTVERLPESDQKLPSDRPYTSNYFLDLIEQIRRYAQIMATTRRKEEKGENLDEMDYSRYATVPMAFGVPLTTTASDEKITLRGGLSRNGRPLELVREKNGKVVPIVDGVEDAHTGFSSNKRALSDDEMDSDEATRSMARRRKSDKPGDVMHLCRDCKKEFKRPCDLTKHEKTHSRPWKCTEQKCKYFDLGWPTEKERDRHVNDKHSSEPAQYKCLYPPCTYASKRESNCKQHMEKAHGWEYVRSKSNGRKKTQASGGDRAPPTPLTPFLDTPQSITLSTPITPFIPSPSVPMLDNFEYPYGIGTPAMMARGFQDDFRRDSTTTDGSNFTYSSGHSPVEHTSFDDAVTPEDTTINHNDVFGNCGLNTNFNNAFRPPTPAMSTGAMSVGYNFESLQFPMASAPSHVPHLSPSGQADMTLYSPPMPADEGFGEMDMDMGLGRPTGDFTLFGNPAPNDLNFGTTNFFPDINQFGGQFDNSAYVEPTTKLDDLMGFDFNQQ
ncbi:hypothetical protein CC80DRAFT_552934 [Byssothecium circinans]|uniref:C2H2-type domain-containing protein n=1 Tax=Byssothecium circinans TaxID=147558 RepID=A0A6A5TGC0_9PLEO|nr:hypothetical protein CC80DRAFT_552934 [Byssothecium circinans]